MRIHNVMEDFVFDILNDTLKKMPNVCQCEHCKLDIAALILNDLKPRYVVSEQGYVYSKTDLLSRQFGTDLTTEVIKAVMVVSENPRHDKN
ncbi:competence protein ComFB [Clostridiales bacterium COT073_COT-073]|nr:competence protein ComFB [Clostridiales bacterium COT073_COT-073]